MNAASVDLSDRTVLVAGATSDSSRTVIGALLEAGARVIAVGSNHERITALVGDLPPVVGEVADLSDEDDVLELAMRVHASVGPVDGVVHLVGGWRGGGGILGQTDDDFRVLERSFSALRHVTRTFWSDVLASPAGRITMVSSTTVGHATAGGANYTAVKAASESWMQSLAHGIGTSGAPAAAVTFRVTALAGLESELAASVVDLWRADAATRGLGNGDTVVLTAE